MSMAMAGGRDTKTGREIMVADYSRRKLLTYADSFRELANSLDSARPGEGAALTRHERQQVWEHHRLWEKQQVLCENMAEVSKILAQVAAEAFCFVPFPEKLRKKVIQAFRSEKIIVTDIYYIQKSEDKGDGQGLSIGISMYCEKAGGYNASQVADMLSVLLDNRLTAAVTCPYQIDRKEKSFVFVEEPVFMVLPGYAKAVRENETVSGDNYSIIESTKGQLSVFLSDGMGSGDKAGRDSEKVLDLMEKLMEAGYDIGTAISLLNNSLSASEEQNMSTLDVCSIDLYSGMCQFRKAGAAATFLKSNTYVEQIVLNTLPLGIFQNLETEVITRELIENDYIIMVTDGVIDALAMGDYEELLQGYIEDLQETNPGEIARKILNFALRCSGGRILDDMTVVVLGVFRGR